MFIGREAELQELERLYHSGKAELAVVYGRRRVGKTELLREFCKGKAHLYFVATLGSDSEQLAMFSQQIWLYTHNEVADDFTFPSWEAALRALTGLPDRPIVVLDEFTYLISGNPSVPSVLQKVWDEVLKSTRLFVILCGSYIGMMEKEVLNYGAALYGRRTGSFLLSAFDLVESAKFFPKYTPVEQIEAWSVLGGMPYYLTAFADQEDIFTNIRWQILREQGLLYNEPQLLLLEELREPRNYFSILRAIAEGRTRLNEIALAAHLESPTTTNRYLDILQSMHLVQRLVPATESRPEKSKRGIYHIRDSFLRFWFRYVQPNRASLELGLSEAILNRRIIPTFNQYTSLSFEWAAREYVARMARHDQLDFLPEQVGGWWSQSAEIDVVAASFSERSLLLGECKWSDKPVGVNILTDLQRKAQELIASGEWQHISYMLFAKAGFTPALEQAAQEQNIRLVNVVDLTRANLD